MDGAPGACTQLQDGVKHVFLVRASHSCLDIRRNQCVLDARHCVPGAPPPQAWVGLPPKGGFNAVKTPLSSIKAVSKVAGSCPPCLLAAGLGGRRRCLSTCRGCLNACHGCLYACRGHLRHHRRHLEQAGAAVWPLFGRKTPAWRYRPRNRPENSGKGSALPTIAPEAASKCLLTGAYF